MEYRNDVLVQKKWYSYLKSYIVIILFAIILTALTSLVLGYKYFIVNGGSARPFIENGSLIMVKKNPTEVEIGDFVTYTRNGTSFVTHRVIEIREDNTFLVSQTGGQLPDQIVLSLNDNYVVGKVQLALPNVNTIIVFIRRNLIELIVFVTGLVISYNYFCVKQNYELEER